ncbi:MAG: hypothetical protein ABH872_04095 [Candidatus Omnitrophota bacterium]
MSVILDIYRKLPQNFKEAAKYTLSFAPTSIRFSKEFFKQLKFLEKSQWFSGQELENYQNEQLAKLINHVYNNVSYYRRLFKAHKLVPSDIKTTKDLPKIPMLTKDKVQENPDDFIAANYKKSDLVHITTSGTTGRVLDIYSDPKSEFLNGGPFEWRFFRWGGYNFNDLCAVFRAHFLKFSKNKRENLFQYNPYQRKVFFSIYDINEDNVKQYIDGLSKYRIKVLQGYPVPLAQLAGILEQNSLKPVFTPKAIFTIAEMLLPSQRDKMQAYFKSKVYDWYGMEERVVVACECREQAGHHINSEFGVLEFIENENSGRDCGLEIVATGFTNYAMPFIRYKTEDYGCLADKQCPCGRQLPLIKITGARKKNFLIDKKGKAHYVIGAMDKFSDFISSYHFVQKKDGIVDLEIVPVNFDCAFKEESIFEDLKLRFGPNIMFNINKVREITKSKGGKIPLVSQGI